MHAYGFLVIIFAISLALPSQTHAENGKESELPACDPVATAKWLTSLYTLQEGKLTFCAEDTDRLIGQIPIAAKAKVSSDGDGMTIDQEGLLSFEPVQVSERIGYFVVFLHRPSQGPLSFR